MSVRGFVKYWIVFALVALSACWRTEMTEDLEQFPSPAAREAAEAAVSGDRATIEGLIRNGSVAPTVTGEAGATLLSLAIRAEDRAMVDLLLSLGALGPPQSETAGTAMYSATLMEDIQYLEALRAAGASLDNTGSGELLLLTAARSRLPGRLEYYINNGATLDARDEIGESATVAMAKTGGYAQVLTLLDAGASPWAVSEAGRGIGFWTHRHEQKLGGNIAPDVEAQRQDVIQRMREAGVPYPPPPAQEVIGMIADGSWRWAP